jgi:hypothetical protein
MQKTMILRFPVTKGWERKARNVRQDEKMHDEV